MPKADELHYKLLTATLDRYLLAVKAAPEMAEEFRATARGSIEAVRFCAKLAEDSELLALCSEAETVLAKD